MQLQILPCLAVSMTAFCLALPGIQAARAGDVITFVPTLHVPVAGVESQAQLADRLRSQGYQDVIMSSVTPSPADPFPWQNPTLTSHPGQTPVHDGWNGVAFRNGQVFQVYADH